MFYRVGIAAFWSQQMWINEQCPLCLMKQEREHCTFPPILSLLSLPYLNTGTELRLMVA